jgi:hypothetical protein
MYLDIYEAIERRHLVQVYYGHYFRVIEPHVYGSDIHGADVLKVYQIAGTDELGRHVGWRWFKVSKMDTVMVLSANFLGSRPADVARQRSLQRIYCEVASSSRDSDQPIELGSYQHR